MIDVTMDNESPLKWSIISDVNKLAFFSEEWDLLNNAVAHSSLFNSPYWLLNWTEQYRQNEWQLYLVTARSDGKLVVLAPFYIQPAKTIWGIKQLYPLRQGESECGVTHYPFAHEALINLGLHIPYKYKINKGHKKWLWRKFTREYIGHDVAFRKKYAFPTLTHIWLEHSEKLLKGVFLQDLLCANVSSIFEYLPKSAPARWALLNIELWGRVHCLGQPKAQLLNSMMSTN